MGLCRPHVTLISGQNGSGKSAVLQGLQTCLGLAARETGRGTQLSGFIKHGADVAVVQVGSQGGGAGGVALGGGAGGLAGRVVVRVGWQGASAGWLAEWWCGLAGRVVVWVDWQGGGAGWLLGPW